MGFLAAATIFIYMNKHKYFAMFKHQQKSDKVAFPYIEKDEHIYLKQT